MKTLSIYAAMLFSIFTSYSSFAQTNAVTTKATIKVWGNCESCKNRIEKAAKKAGATTASWNEDSKELAVSFNVSKTSSEKIQQAIAAAGHDTQDFSAPNTAYNKLPGCCQYDRKAGAAAEVKKCCANDKCGKEANACKGMACCKDKAFCKEKACSHDHANTGAYGKEMSCCKKQS